MPPVLRATFRKIVERLDRGISLDNSGDERDGFLFPFHKFMPSHGVGIVSLLVLAVTIPAPYFFHLAGPRHGTYVISAVIALYLDVFV